MKAPWPIVGIILLADAAIVLAALRFPTFGIGLLFLLICGGTAAFFAARRP